MAAARSDDLRPEDVGPDEARPQDEQPNEARSGPLRAENLRAESLPSVDPRDGSRHAVPSLPTGWPSLPTGWPGRPALPRRPDRPALPGGATARRVRMRRRSVLVTGLVLVMVLAGVLIARAAGLGPGHRPTIATRAVAWPEAPATSPATPPDDHPWAGTVLPSTPGAHPAPAPSDAGGWQVTDTAYCTSARAGLATLGSQALSTLTTLATRTGDTVPATRAFVQQSLDQATRLRDAAPAILTDSFSTLVSAWSGLSGDLARVGYDRADLVALSIKYLTNPAVALSWELLTRWTASNCGVDLLGGQSTAA
jgi:hypothetical protein